MSEMQIILINCQGHSILPK
uniref:Uncharacterized protein n=1 Tax=Anguilla anguilla TaxID=7936 RepID=A0A0E9TXD2_ANGAN